MPTRIEFTRQASADFIEIHAYLSVEAGPRTAAQIIEQITTRIDRLADFPKIRPVSAILGDDRRTLVSRSCVIVYGSSKIAQWC